MKNYGLIIKPRDPRDYQQFGGVSMVHKEVRRADGQWIDFVPQGEIQTKNNVETMSCVSFGTLNVLEILEKVKFGEVSNYSDRYLAIASNTSPQGNSPKDVAEVLRKTSGCIPEEMFPFSPDIKSFEEYHSPKPLPSKYTSEGKNWLKKYEMGYEWVTPSPEELMVSLQYSPLGIAVEAWKQDEKGYYYGGNNPNHWTVLAGYIKGDCWLVYDSYPTTGGSYCKKLRWDYKFNSAMSYSLNKKLNKKKEAGFWEKIRLGVRWWFAEILK